MSTENSTHTVVVRSAVPEDFTRFRQRIAQISLDSFTTGFYAYNAGRLTEDRTIEYMLGLLRDGGSGFIAFDAGTFAHPDYPIGFLFTTPFAKDKLLSKTPLADEYPVDRSAYLAELAVDVGHRKRGVASRLIEAFLHSLNPEMINYVFVRTNEADVDVRRFYISRGFTELSVVAEYESRSKKRYFVRRLVA